MSANPETAARLHAALLRLAEDAHDVARSPDINDEGLRNHVENLGTVCERLARESAGGISAGLADDLASVKLLLKAAGAVDDPLTEDRSYQAKQVARSLRALRTSVQDALDAAHAAGLPEQAGLSSEAGIPVSLNDLKAGWVHAITTRLDAILARLDDLRAEADPAAHPSRQQREILTYVDQRMQTQVRLARLTLDISGILHLPVLTRAVEAIATLVRDFRTTVRTMATKISRAVAEKADALRVNVRRLTTGTRSLARASQRARRDSSSITEPPPADEARSGTDLFISYSARDRALVAPFIAALEARGFSIWHDRLLTAGKSFRDEIFESINRARVMVVIWTPNSVTSSWVVAEASAALRRAMAVPVRSADLNPNDIPPPFNELHTPLMDDTDAVARALEPMFGRSEPRRGKSR